MSYTIGISFKLINIEKFTFLKFGNEKSIVDKSTNINLTSDIFVRNLIDSPFNISYSKKTQILSNNLPRKIGVSNNKKVNFHNIIVIDSYGNRFFLKDYPFNTTIWYADCNMEATNCVVYSNFLMENNIGIPACFEEEKGKVEGQYYNGNLTKLEYFYVNPSACYDFKNIN